MKTITTSRLRLIAIQFKFRCTYFLFNFSSGWMQYIIFTISMYPIDLPFSTLISHSIAYTILHLRCHYFIFSMNIGTTMLILTKPQFVFPILIVVPLPLRAYTYAAYYCLLPGIFTLSSKHTSGVVKSRLFCLVSIAILVTVSIRKHNIMIWSIQ